MLGAQANACDLPHMPNIFKGNYQQVTAYCKS